MKTRRNVLLVLAMAAVGACSDGSEVAGPAEVRDPLVQRVVEMGFPREQIVDHGDFFLVQGDIRVFKRDLQRTRRSERGGKIAPGGFSAQRTAGTVADNRRIIRVDISPLEAQNASWANATRAAMANWSSVPGSYVSFVEGTPADVTVSVGYYSQCTAGAGNLPVNGAPGATVEVNGYVMGYYGYSQQVWVMTHELGHTIGFTHTNEAGHSQIYGTPTSDGGSVMNSGAAYGCASFNGPNAPNWSGFSYYDQVAMQRLYPIPAPTGLYVSQSGGTVLVHWNTHPAAIGYELQRFERRTNENAYEGWSYVDDYPGGWVEATANPFNTGNTWTGTSTCYWYNGTYQQDYSDYWYEVRAVFPTGAGPAAAVGSQDATC